MLRILLLLALAGVAYWWFSDPYGTRIPFNRTDPAAIAKIQPQIDRLPPGDRALMLGYLRDSGSDVLPGTPTTFKEAIAWERKFQAEQASMQATTRALKQARADQLAPLRKALTVEMVRREILPRSQVLGQPSYTQTADGTLIAHDVDTTEVLAVTYRLTNHGDQPITAFTVDINTHKVSRDRDEFLPIDTCFMDRRPQTPALEPGASIELPCMGRWAASAKDRAYVALDPQALDVDVEPRLIRFANGEELTYRD